MSIVRALESIGARESRVAVVLGSGLAAFARVLEDVRAAPFAEIAGMPESSVPGHAGRFLTGRVGGELVLVQEGRLHLYEGRSAEQVCAPVRAFAEVGVRSVVLTNAAGSLRRGWALPRLMRVVDHLDRQGAAPLGRGAGGRGLPYDPGAGAAIDRAATEAGVALERGVYAGLLGPAYETPAEIAMLAWMGADAVGMSTVCEAQAARSAGMRVAAVSCLTNLAAGLAPRPLDHAEVLTAGAEASRSIAALLARAIPLLSDESGSSRPSPAA